ncbi:MAG: DNA topoisomerase I, partial [bacterium]|nr:DNA topoisomerase I [bacterium]
PYLKMGSDSRSLSTHEQLSTVTLDEAVELFKQPKGRRKAQTSVLAELGQHPETGGAIQTKSGRYGVYVTDGVVNATVPKAKDPDSLTLPDALLLLAAREQKLRDQGKDPRAPKAKGRRRAKKSS